VRRLSSGAGGFCRSFVGWVLAIICTRVLVGGGWGVLRACGLGGLGGRAVVSAVHYAWSNRGEAMLRSCDVWTARRRPMVHSDGKSLFICSG